MSQIVNAGLATPGDIRSLGVNPALRKLATRNGVNVEVPVSNIQQQRDMVNELCRATRRNTVKQITINNVVTNATNTLVIGNTLGLSADANVAITQSYQNAAAAAGNAAQLTAFKAAVNSYPFRYVGIKMDVSDVACFSTTWTELINDYDTNCTQPFNEKIDLGQNIFSETPTTRLIPVAGEFNGFWGLKTDTLPNAATVKFTFYVVEIQRGW